MSKKKKKPEGYTFGRPSKYKPEYCQQIIDYMSQGLSLTAFACEIDTTRDCLYDWAEKHEDFHYALKKAQHNCEKWWEARGMKGMNESGQRFNAGVWTFFMKNRFKWTDRTETNQTIEVTEKEINEVKEAIKRLEE